MTSGMPVSDRMQPDCATPDRPQRRLRGFDARFAAVAGEECAVDARPACRPRRDTSAIIAGSRATLRVRRVAAESDRRELPILQPARGQVAIRQGPDSDFRSAPKRQRPLSFALSCFNVARVGSRIRFRLTGGPSDRIGQLVRAAAVGAEYQCAPISARAHS